MPVVAEISLTGIPSNTVRQKTSLCSGGELCEGHIKLLPYKLPQIDCVGCILRGAEEGLRYLLAYGVFGLDGDFALLAPEIQYGVARDTV